MRTEQQILDSLVTRGLSLIRYSNGLQRAADDDLLRLVRDLRVLLAVGVDGIGRRELLALLREIDTVITTHIGLIAERQNAALPGLLSSEASYAVVAAGVANQVSQRQLDLLVRDFAIFGLPLRQSWAALARDLSQRVSAEVRQAVAVNLPAADLISRVIGNTRQNLPLNLEIRLPNRAPPPVMADGSVITPIRRRARQLTDAVVQTAAGDAQFAAWRANGMNAVKWHAILDAKVCPACGIRAGKLWDLQAKPVAHEVALERRPPAHFWCVTGDTRVKPSGQIKAATKRPYSGDLVIIRTASGNELSCTPNHPVLTDRGWVAAGLLDVGGNVISNRVIDRNAHPGDVDSQDVPARIEEIARTFGESLGVGAKEMPVSAEDFHGDGAGSNVAVVWANRHLLGDCDSSGAQHSDQLGFHIGDSQGRTDSAVTGGPVDSLGHRLRDAASGLVGCGSPSLSGIGRGAGCGQDISRAAVASADSSLLQSAVDGESSDPEAASQCEHRLAGEVALNDLRIRQFLAVPVFAKPALSEQAVEDAAGYSRLANDILTSHAGQVFADAVVEKRLVDFSGHVYNLETETGWYVANGIVNHNCRCILLPMQYPDGKPPADGGEERDSFEDWLGRRPPEDAERILGVGRADLYRRGVITLQDLINQNGQVLTLAQLRAMRE